MRFYLFIMKCCANFEKIVIILVLIVDCTEYKTVLKQQVFKYECN